MTQRTFDSAYIRMLRGTGPVPATQEFKEAVIRDYLLGKAAEDLLDRQVDGEAVVWLDLAGGPIDFSLPLRLDLAAVVEVYYSWDVLQVRGMKHMADVLGDTQRLLAFPYVLQQEVIACRRSAE